MFLTAALLAGGFAGESFAAVNYTYDAAGRLTHVAYDNGDTLVYLYDANSNILSETLETDSDMDGVFDGADNCPNSPNPLQENSDLDPQGDACDNDDDDDGIPDTVETANGLSRTDPSDAVLDKDNDGLSNLDEFLLGTGIGNPDTDGDGISDGDEVAVGSDPLVNKPAAAIQIIDSILLGNE